MKPKVIPCERNAELKKKVDAFAETLKTEAHMILLGRALDDIMADLLKKHLELVEEFNKFNLVHF